MKSGLVLMLSAAVNVALVIAAAQLLRARVPVPVPSQVMASQHMESLRSVTNLPPKIAFVTNAFHWRQLESTNYDAFVANLRAVGCPERTLRDLLVAEVWERYEAAQRQEEDSLPYWLNGPRRVAADRAREFGLMQLKHDLAAILQRLVGISWSPEMPRDAFGEGSLLCRVLLGDVTEEQFERAAGWLGRVEEAKEEVRWRARGILLDEDYAELARRREEIERELRMILTPAQFEEFRARVGAAERILGHLFGGDALEGVKPTPAELRQIALAQTEVWPPGWEVFDLDEAETPEQNAAREQAMDTRLGAILGEERFAEALRLRDGDYRALHQFAEANPMPKETVLKLYQIQKLAREEVRRVREDSALGSGARSARVEAVAGAVAPQVRELLGQKLFGEYVRQSGRWVTNANTL